MAEEIDDDGLGPIEAAYNEEECLPEPDAQEVSASRSFLGLGPDNSNEDSVARHVLRIHSQDLLHVHDTGGPNGALAMWYGTRWGIGGTRALDGAISDICQDLSRTLPAPDPACKRIDYRQKLLAANFQQGVRHIVQGLIAKPGPTSVSIDDFNKDPWVLGVDPAVRDGKVIPQVIDLRTATIMDSGRDARLTWRLRMPVDFNTEPVLWNKTLLEIMSGEADRATLMEELMGYSLSGSARYEMWIVLGSPPDAEESLRGRNGKDVILKVLRDLAGPAGLSMGAETIVRGKHAETDKKRIYGAFDGKRVVTLSEVNESAGERVDDSFVKELTGGAGGSGCDVYKPRKGVQQTWSIWVAQNTPMVLQNSASMWDRTVYFDFKEQFRGERCNPQLKEQLKAEYPSILGRLAKACARVYKAGLLGAGEVRKSPLQGLSMTPSVLASGAKLFQFTDYGARFCAEKLRKGTGDDFISNSELAESYREFVLEVGEPGANPTGGKALARAIADLGGTRGKRGDRGSQKNGWVGVTFVSVSTVSTAAPTPTI